MFIHQKLSSNINEVIRSVLNLFFFMIRFYMHKKHKKNTRHQKVPKSTKHCIAFIATFDTKKLKKYFIKTQ